MSVSLVKSPATTSAPLLYDGKPSGDTYAISLLCPARYIGGMVERTVYRNIRGTSAADALRAVDARELDRVVAVWPERF